MSDSASGGDVAIQVVQYVPEDFDPGQIIVDFLEQLDPGTVETTALEAMSWGGGTLTQEIIEVIKKAARGAVS